MRRMRPTAIRGVLLIAGGLLLAGGCGADAPGLARPGARDPAGRTLYLQSLTESGRTAFLIRVDGDVQDSAKFPLWGEEDQTVAVTGLCPGEDQRKILVYGQDGRQVAEWRPSGDNPYGFRQYQHLVPRTLELHEVGGRKCLAIITTGNFFPASFVLVEAEPGLRLTERLTLWNPGALNNYAVEAETLVFTGLNNRIQVGEEGLEPRSAGGRYPVGLGIVDLSPLPREPGARRRIEVPASVEGTGSGFRYYFLLPILDTRGDSQGPVIRIRGDEARLSLASGLTFVAHMKSGVHRFECSEGYRAAYHRRRKAGDPPIEEWIRGLEKAVHSWSGKRP